MSVKRQKPLIHCITNPISINQCANAILALGALPIMAEHPEEVEEITETANALMINLGNITDARIESAGIALKTARQKDIPAVLDAVGSACSQLRRRLALRFMESGSICILKGNYSEIRALAQPDYKFRGVDASADLSTAEITKDCMVLSDKYNCVVLASGKTDIVTDSEKTALIHNGTPKLSSITGTGCMQGAITAVYASQKQYFEATVLGAAILGICGEIADKTDGTGSFFVSLMDNLSTLTDEELLKRIKTEVKEIEKY